MAELDLRRIYLHDADDLDSYEYFYSATPEDERAVRGETQQAANGRLRTIVRTGSQQTVNVTLRDVTPAQLEWLDTRKGALLLYRDPSGRFLFGSFFAFGDRAYKGASNYDVSFTFQQTTRTIEV